MPSAQSIVNQHYDAFRKFVPERIESFAAVDDLLEKGIGRDLLTAAVGRVHSYEYTSLEC